jgi:hypothetical protein
MADRIPAKVHFVWVGAPIPDKQGRQILEWSRQNPGYTVHLWTDKPRENARRLGECWESPPAHVKISATESKHLPGRNSQFGYTNDTHQVRSIVRLRDVLSLAGTLGAELAGRAAQELYNRQYGAASDILRIAILKKEGGIYLDTDSETATPLPGSLTAEDGILFGYFTGAGANATFSNAVIAAPRDHAYLDQIQESMSAEYKAWSEPRKAEKAHWWSTPKSAERLIDQYRHGVDDARKTKAENPVLLKERMEALTLVVTGPSRIVLWLYQHVLEQRGQAMTPPETWLEQRHVSMNDLNYLARGKAIGETYFLMVVKPVLQDKSVRDTYAFPDKYVTIRSDASWIK